MGKSKANLSALSRAKRHQHIRRHLSGTAERPRLVVFRSSKHIYAQLVDDIKGHTLVAISSQAADLAKDLAEAKAKVDRATIVGVSLAEKAKAAKIEKVVFDRAGYLYHGRVKALAEGARKGGLLF